MSANTNFTARIAAAIGALTMTVTLFAVSFSVPQTTTAIAGVLA